MRPSTACSSAGKICSFPCKYVTGPQWSVESTRSPLVRLARYSMVTTVSVATRIPAPSLMRSSAARRPTSAPPTIRRASTSGSPPDPPLVDERGARGHTVENRPAGDQRRDPSVHGDRAAPRAGRGSHSSTRRRSARGSRSGCDRAIAATASASACSVARKRLPDGTDGGGAGARTTCRPVRQHPRRRERQRRLRGVVSCGPAARAATARPVASSASICARRDCASCRSRPARAHARRGHRRVVGDRSS